MCTHKIKPEVCGHPNFTLLCDCLKCRCERLLSSRKGFHKILEPSCGRSSWEHRRGWPLMLRLTCLTFSSFFFFHHWCWMGVKCKSDKLFHTKLWKPCLCGPEWAFLKLLQHSRNATIKMTSHALMLWFSLIGTRGLNPNHGKQPQSRNTTKAGAQHSSTTQGLPLQKHWVKC